MKTLEEKIALVTGASRGIGRGIAIELAKSGAKVIINYKSNDIEAKKTLAMVREFNKESILIKGDISKIQDIDRISKEAIEAFGRIDILVNNAGVSKIGLFIDESYDNALDMINTNLLGPMFLTKNILKNMLDNGSGNIVNISSIWGQSGASCEVLYSVSKGGINQFTKSLAKEYAMSNIRVNSIAPGVIDTEMNKSFTKEEIDSLKEEIPQGRFGLPKEIGRAVVFLCDDRCKYLTGEVLKIDGGLI